MFLYNQFAFEHRGLLGWGWSAHLAKSWVRSPPEHMWFIFAVLISICTFYTCFVVHIITTGHCFETVFMANSYEKWFFLYKDFFMFSNLLFFLNKFIVFLQVCMHGVEKLSLIPAHYLHLVFKNAQIYAHSKSPVE